MAANRKAGVGDLPLAVERYWRDGDVTALSAALVDFYLRFMRARLCRDPDTISEFYLYLQPRLATMMNRFRGRQDTPFRSYMAAYLRLEFQNFWRIQSRQIEAVLDTDFVEETVSWQGEEDSDRIALRERALAALEGTPIESRLPLKLYHGIALGLAELRAVSAATRCPNQALQFVERFQKRCARAALLSDRTRDRALELQRWATKSENPRLRNRWRRIRQSLLRRQQTERGVLPISEIASLLGISKSTVARRMERGLELLRVQLKGPHPESTAMEAMPC